ncbi:MAG: riboflavin biosynthesis protein RibF [Synergistaceae bacterium]|jgi:riboflavin kinase/FMN adenylyltransferase|nr:riboflavin biosynthesis protein RibF [Synergistaceae bacterium]
MIAAVGAFDGFHKGHQALLERARTIAAGARRDWGAVTFARHPDEFIFPEKNFKFLYSQKERRMLGRFFAIPTVREIEFTPRIANMSPAEFLDFISGEFGVDGIVVGEGFRFGKNREGTADFLSGECQKRNWPLGIVSAVNDLRGEPISSTSIRDTVAAGDMRYAWETQGHPYFCAGLVVHGNERGRTIGFPTANLETAPEKVGARRGSYAALAFVNGHWRAGAANIGLNPTFNDVRGTRFEVFLLDFEGDIYGVEIAVFLLERLRDETRFANIDELKEQISQNVGETREIAERFLRAEQALWEKFREAFARKKPADPARTRQGAGSIFL